MWKVGIHLTIVDIPWYILFGRETCPGWFPPSPLHQMKPYIPWIVSYSLAQNERSIFISLQNFSPCYVVNFTCTHNAWCRNLLITRGTCQCAHTHTHTHTHSDPVLCGLPDFIQVLYKLFVVIIIYWRHKWILLQCTAVVEIVVESCGQGENPPRQALVLQVTVVVAPVADIQSTRG